MTQPPDDGVTPTSAPPTTPPAPPPTPTSARALGQRAGRGALSVVVTSGLVNVMQLASSLVLARALVPEEYGAFAVAATVVGFGRFLGDCGAGSAVIQQPGSAEPDRRELGRALWLQLAVAVVAATALILAAPAIRAAFEAPPQTSTIVRFMALTLLLEAPAVVAKVRLNRAQEYQRLQVVSLASYVALYCVQIGGLLAGFGLASLVAGQLLFSVVSTALLLGLGGGVVRPQPRGAVALARRGLPYQGALTVQAMFAIASVGVVGTQLSTAELGLWTWCTVLATPLLALAMNLQNLAFPALARLHEHHSAQHRAAVSLAARLQLLPVAVVVGTLCGLTVPVVQHVFDPRWLGAVDAARAALLAVVPFLLAALLAATAQSMGRPGLRLRAMALSTLVGVVCAVPLAARFGTTGAAVAIFTVVPLVDALLLLLWVRVPVRRAVLGAAAVGVGSFGVATLLAPYADRLVGLVAVGAVTGLVGLALCVALDLPALREGWRTVRARGDGG